MLIIVWKLSLVVSIEYMENKHSEKRSANSIVGP